VYTRVGKEAYATGPEIAIALELGAKVEVLHGYHFQTTGGLLLAPYLSGPAQARERSKGPLEEKLLKLAINSLYGKQAQGLYDKFKYDINERQCGADQPPMPSCDIPCPIRLQ
jgi:hypothetical protein